jgi:hypothetical protein
MTKEQVEKERIKIDLLYRESQRHPSDGPDGGVWEPVFETTKTDYSVHSSATELDFGTVLFG